MTYVTRQLGLIPSPLELLYSGANRTSFRCPEDPQYYTRGEAGYYYDTPLGGLGTAHEPSDLELASMRQYMPTNSGWIATTQGPKSPDHRFTLGDATPVNSDDPTSAIHQAANAALAELEDHHKKTFALAVFQTTFVVLGSIIAIARTAKLMKQGR